MTTLKNMIMTRKKLSFRFSKWFNYCLICLLAVNYSCNKTAESPYSKLQQFFTKHGIELSSKYKYIFYLTEQECPSCNRAFGSYIAKRIGDQNALFVIGASGTLVDISVFENTNSVNIVQDDNGSFADLGILKKSGTIFLKNNNIDSIMPIDLNEMIDQFSNLSQRTGHNLRN